MAFSEALHSAIKPQSQIMSLMQVGDRKERGWNQQAQVNARLSTVPWHGLKPASSAERSRKTGI